MNDPYDEEQQALDVIHINKLEADLAVALAENAQLDEALDATLEKVAALSPHGTCGCSYDRPGDLCMHHSPQLVAAQEEIEQLKQHRQFLWDLLDNIDTLDDSCKGDDALFRKSAYAQQQRRYMIGASNGYTVDFDNTIMTNDKTILLAQDILHTIADLPESPYDSSEFFRTAGCFPANLRSILEDFCRGKNVTVTRSKTND